MTLLGKIFTVLIFIMSVAFCILAVATFATHKNWRLAVSNPTGTPKGYKEQVEELTQTTKDLQLELQTAKGELAIEQAARKAALATLQAKLALVQADMNKANEELLSKTSALTQQTSAAETAEKSLANITAEVNKLRGEIRVAQQDRDEQFLKAVALVDKLNQAEALRERLETQNAQLQEQYARLKFVADKKGIDANMIVAEIPPPLDGVVTYVDEAKGIVEVSLGKDDGMRRGHMVQIFSGSKYLGQIILREVNADRSVGDIDKKMQRGRIKKGDNVTTKLS
jgi:hypothetical protein